MYEYSGGIQVRVSKGYWWRPSTAGVSTAHNLATGLSGNGTAYFWLPGGDPKGLGYSIRYGV